MKCIGIIGSAHGMTENIKYIQDNPIIIMNLKKACRDREKEWKGKERSKYGSNKTGELFNLFMENYRQKYKVAGSAAGQNRAIKDRNSNVIRFMINCERRDTDGLGKDN